MIPQSQLIFWHINYSADTVKLTENKKSFKNRSLLPILCHFKRLTLLKRQKRFEYNKSLIYRSTVAQDQTYWILNTYWILSWPACCNLKGQHSLAKHLFVCYTPSLRSWAHSQPRVLLQLQAGQSHFQLKLCTPQLGEIPVKIFHWVL